MPLRSNPSPIFVSLLDALPLQLAQGFAILECDVAESIAVRLFEQRMTLALLQSSAATNGDDIIFEGTMDRARVQIPENLTLSISHVRCGIRRADASFAINVRGRAELEIPMPTVLGGKSIILAGMLHIATQPGLALESVRIDFDDAAWAIPLPGGASLDICSHSLHVLLADGSASRLEMTVSCAVRGLAPRLELALGQTSFQAIVRWSKDGLNIFATTVCESLTIPLPSFPAFANNPAWNLGEMSLSAKYLRISVGRTVEASIDIGVDTPVPLHDIMQPHIDFRVTTIDDEVHIELLSSPFRSLECQRVPNGSLRLRMPLGGGTVSFDLPALRVDWGRRCIVADGQIAHQNVRIPLTVFRSVLERMGLHSLAQQLPHSITLQHFGLAGMMAAFLDLIPAAEHQGLLAATVRTAVKHALDNVHHLPQDVQDVFLQSRVPREIAYSLECSFDFDVRIHFATTHDRTQIESSPVRLIVPCLGPHGPELLRLTLYRWALGEIHAGQVGVFEIDCEIKRFDLTPRGVTLAPSSSSHLVLRDVVGLFGQTAGAPWILPLRFRKIGWTHTSASGMTGAFQCELSWPDVDFRTLIRDLVFLQDGTRFSAETSAYLDKLECRVGPAYLRLPRALGGNEFGSTDQVHTLRSPKEIERLLIAWHSLNLDHFLEAILSSLGQRNIELEIGPEHDKTRLSAKSLVEPLLHVLAAHPLGRETQRLKVQLERVTRSGLRFCTNVPDMIPGESRDVYFDWPWPKILDA